MQKKSEEANESTTSKRKKSLPIFWLFLSNDAKVVVEVEIRPLTASHWLKRLEYLPVRRPRKKILYLVSRALWAFSTVQLNKRKGTVTQNSKSRAVQ